MFGSKKIVYSLFKVKRVLTLFTLFFLFSLKAQINLITNPSFEDSISIPTSHSEINKCNNWLSPNNTTPDYYSVYSPTFVISPGASVAIPKNVFGYQKAKHGNFYTGIVTKNSGLQGAGYPAYSNYIELMQTPLKQQLIKDHIYDFLLFYSLADGGGTASNQLQAYFSVSQFTAIPYDPLNLNSYFNNLPCQIEHDTTIFITDTMNWQPLNGCFISNGGEQYVTIGNFRDGVKSKYINVNRNTAFNDPGILYNDLSYLFIDDLSLYDLGYYSGKAQCKNDTVICFNSSITISSNIKDSSIIAWQPHPSLSCTNCQNPIATPTTTTKYYVTKTLCSFITKDSITVTVITPSVLANAGINDTICLGKNTRIGTADSTYFTNYIWQPNISLSCVNCAMPYANPISNITYTLQRNQCNITNNSTVSITVEDCEPTYTVPTIFTPNGDGVNDTWGVNFSNTQYIKNFQLNIVNRWGVPILQTPNESQKDDVKVNFPAIKWDGHTTSGEVCSDGIYFYFINFELNGEKKTFKGNVTLIR
ncbi:MAG: gliding motility-associated C-terminal domain-containing protein [Bacteroidota bacterium]|nr:gliding motility-associated C-terminal domain-containing protein [Bacteroidota bacterium]